MSLNSIGKPFPPHRNNFLLREEQIKIQWNEDSTGSLSIWCRIKDLFDFS